MAGSNELLRDFRTTHSLAFGVGSALAIVVIWQLRPAGVMTTLDGTIGLLLVGVSFLLVLVSERLQETIRREPLYFAAGVAMGAVLGAKLFV